MGIMVQVHRDDEEPYYTVRVIATGRERQTNANRLVRRPRETAEAGKEGQEKGENGDQSGDTEVGRDTEAVDGIDPAGAHGQ